MKNKIAKHVDIVIIGGGITGLALACGLHGSGLRIVVVEQRLLEPSSFAIPPVSRVSAINAASERLLTRLGVWSDIIALRANCYHGIEVWDKDNFGYISFNDKILGYDHLGYIIDNTILHMVLWKKAQRCADITLISPAQPQKIVWGENEAFITLNNNDIFTARLMVSAEGTNSWLRSKAEIPTSFWDYYHHALIATVQTDEPHDSIARQIFHNDGILAFLPLSDPHLCSVVWSLNPENAQKMYKAESKTFNQELCVTFDNRLGLCALTSERRIFQLTGHYAHQFATHRLVLIGDAAHTIHPLAGQGVNLGLMDVAKLIENLCYLHRKGKDIGQYLYLRKYERNRKHSAVMMLIAMQSFCELFTGSFLIKKLIRNLGLRLAHTLPSMKEYFLRQAMGLNDLPNWLC